MSASDLVQQLIAGQYHDPDTGQFLDVNVRTVVIEDTLAGGEWDLVADLAMGRHLAVVSDPDTHAALGARVERALADHVQVTPIRLPSRPHADDATVAAIRTQVPRVDGYLAVGSGTVNDLCKHAAALDGKPYAVFATAPSMNGYTSVNAAITVNGHKRSLPAKAPQGVFMDLAVLAAAPHRLIRAGFGDSLCRSTAQADWLLSHLLIDTPYRSVPFDLLLDGEERLLAEPGSLLSGNPAALASLARTLILSGFGMTVCGGSYPASQGEHLISHVIEMTAPEGWSGALHGEQIAVTTLTMARLQSRALEGPAPVLAPTQVDRQAVLDYFGAEVGAACWAEFRQKALSADRAAALNHRIAERWDSVRAAIGAVARPVGELERAVQAIGAPSRAADIGLEAGFYREAVVRARQIRNRFTFLDLALDSWGNRLPADM